MKELVPNKKSGVIPFALSVQETLDKIDMDSGMMHISDGRIFEHGKFACISKGSLVEVVNIKSGLRSSACDFTSPYQKLIVTCVIPSKSKFIVGLRGDNATNTGMICIYDPGVSRVIKTIRLQAAPISISIIREFGGVSYETSLLSDALRCMFGIIAVGTEDGHLYLIDMRADDGEDCSFTPPNSMLFIDSCNAGNAPKMRDKARSHGQYCCVDLTCDFFSSTFYKYVGAGGNTLKMYDKGNCGITCLLYLQQSVSLVVGYSFGSFQVWSLQDLEIKYSSPVLTVSSPISHFAFQEPENDPRHCCFLWVGRGPLPSQTECFSPTSITLYQVLYGIKQRIEGYGILYKQLDVVARRFEHQLTADAHHLVDSRSVGSRIISFNTLDSNDSTVCIIVWETPGTDANMSISCHLGIFDLNRYYEKQLPRSIRDAMYGKMEAVCPFFAFYLLTDIAEDFLPGGILDVYLDVKSIHWFRTSVAPQIEQYSWPSSASFKLTCLSEIGTIEVEMLGMQKQIIADMIKMGTDSFLDIGNLIQSCCVAGLLQNSFGARQQNGDKLYTDALLSIALEHSGMIFITSCIKKWSHGSITHAGHSLKLLYDWAWAQVIQRKRTLDELHLALFNSVAENLEIEQLNQLKTISSQLKDLSEILNELKRSNVMTLDVGTQELETRSQVTLHISMYTEILLLLVDCTLLPEKSDYIEATQSDKITYNAKLLSDYYEVHRSTNGNEENLFIDVMWKGMEFPEDVKEENENDVLLYPPSSIEIMCRLFVHNMPSDKEKTTCPFYYWFLDLCECYGQLHLKNVASKFKQFLKLSYTEEVLVKSAWLLDHKLYNEASTHLLMLDVKISSLYYHHIVKLFYKQGEMDLLALFLANKQPNNSCTIEQMKFLIYVMLQMGKLSNAYKLQSSILFMSKKESLFNYFVEQCIQNKLLQRLMMLPVTAEEENMLHNYLVMSTGNEDYLLVYYLERGLFSKASEVTRRLKAVSALKLDQVNQDHLQTQCLLVDGFSQIVPDIQQKLNDNMEKLPRKLSGTPTSKTPLSSVLIKEGQSGDHTPILYNSLFNSKTYEKDGINNLLTNNMTRRRKSPLFDAEPVSPKKQKEMDTSSTNLDMSSQIYYERTSLHDIGNPFMLLTTPASTKRNYSKISVGNTKQPQSILKLKSYPAVHEKLNIDSPAFSSGKRIRFVDIKSPNESSSSMDGSFLEKSPDQSSSSMDGSFLDSQSKEEISTNSFSLISESSFTSATEEFQGDENIWNKETTNENAASEHVPTIQESNLFGSYHGERSNDTNLVSKSVNIENILQDLQNSDEEPIGAMKPKRLSLGAEENISKIIKAKENLSVLLPKQHEYMSAGDHYISGENELDESAPITSSAVCIPSIQRTHNDIISDDSQSTLTVAQAMEAAPLVEKVEVSNDLFSTSILHQHGIAELKDPETFAIHNEHVQKHFSTTPNEDASENIDLVTPNENVSENIELVTPNEDVAENIESVISAHDTHESKAYVGDNGNLRSSEDDRFVKVQHNNSTDTEKQLGDPVMGTSDVSILKECREQMISSEEVTEQLIPIEISTESNFEEISEDEADNDVSVGSSDDHESMTDSSEDDNSVSENSVVSLSSSDSNDVSDVSIAFEDKVKDVKDTTKTENNEISICDFDSNQQNLQHIIDSKVEVLDELEETIQSDDFEGVVDNDDVQQSNLLKENKEDCEDVSDLEQLTTTTECRSSVKPTSDSGIGLVDAEIEKMYEARKLVTPTETVLDMSTGDDEEWKDDESVNAEIEELEARHHGVVDDDSFSVSTHLDDNEQFLNQEGILDASSAKESIPQNPNFESLVNLPPEDVEFPVNMLVESSMSNLIEVENENENIAKTAHKDDEETSSNLCTGSLSESEENKSMEIKGDEETCTMPTYEGNKIYPRIDIAVDMETSYEYKKEMISLDSSSEHSQVSVEHLEIVDDSRQKESFTETNKLIGEDKLMDALPPSNEIFLEDRGNDSIDDFKNAESTELINEHNEDIEVGNDDFKVVPTSADLSLSFATDIYKESIEISDQDNMTSSYNKESCVETKRSDDKVEGFLSQDDSLGSCDAPVVISHKNENLEKVDDRCENSDVCNDDDDDDDDNDNDDDEEYAECDNDYDGDNESRDVVVVDEDDGRGVRVDYSGGGKRYRDQEGGKGDVATVTVATTAVVLGDNNDDDYNDNNDDANHGDNDDDDNNHNNDDDNDDGGDDDHEKNSHYKLSYVDINTSSVPIYMKDDEVCAHDDLEVKEVISMEGVTHVKLLEKVVINEGEDIMPYVKTLEKVEVINDDEYVCTSKHENAAEKNNKQDNKNWFEESNKCKPIVATYDVEMKINLSEDDGLVIGSKQEHLSEEEENKLINIIQESDNSKIGTQKKEEETTILVDELDKPVLMEDVDNHGDLIETSDKVIILSDVCDLESSIEYESHHVSIDYAEHVNTSHPDVSTTDHPELVKRMEEMDVQKEVTHGKMEWKDNLQQSLPKTSSPVFLPTKEVDVDESSEIKSTLGSSSEDKDSVITTHVRTLRRRTVYRRDLLTPRTNKFRIKPTNELSCEDIGTTSSTNISERDRQVSDSDAQVYHKRYNSAKNMQKMKSLDNTNVNIVLKETNKKGVVSPPPPLHHRESTRKTRKSTRLARQYVEESKDDSSASNVENEDNNEKTRISDTGSSLHSHISDESLIKNETTDTVKSKAVSCNKMASGKFSRQIDVSKKKQCEVVAKYFTMDDSEESSSDDIEIESEDLEMYLGLTRKRAGRTRKTVKGGISPIQEEIPHGPQHDYQKDVGLPKKRRGRPRKTAKEGSTSLKEEKILPASQHTDQEENIMMEDENESRKEKYSDNQPPTKDVIPPHKKMRLILKSAGKSITSEHKVKIDEDAIHTEIREERRDESEEDSDDDDEDSDSPLPMRITRSQKRSTLRVTRSQSKLFPTKSPLSSRSSCKSPVKTPLNVEKTSLKPAPEMIYEPKSIDDGDGDGDDDADDDADDDGSGHGDNDHSDNDNEKREILPPRITRSQRNLFSANQSALDESNEWLINSTKNMPSRKPRLKEFSKRTQNNIKSLNENISSSNMLTESKRYNDENVSSSNKESKIYDDEDDPNGSLTQNKHKILPLKQLKYPTRATRSGISSRQSANQLQHGESFGGNKLVDTTEHSESIIDYSLAEETSVDDNIHSQKSLHSSDVLSSNSAPSVFPTLEEIRHRQSTLHSRRKKINKNGSYSESVDHEVESNDYLSSARETRKRYPTRHGKKNDCILQVQTSSSDLPDNTLDITKSARSATTSTTGRSLRRRTAKNS